MTTMASYPQFMSKSRLPNFAIPKRYNLYLKPDLISCIFHGVVSITIDVVSTTNFLVLNVADLNIDYSSLSFHPQSSSQGLRPAEVELIAEDEVFVIDFGKELPIGVGVLRISFQGTLNDGMKGFYRSVYEVNGEKRNLAVTQFEPADARRCFPCWDEPVFKATFKITLDVSCEVIALSNMHVIEEKEQGSFKTVYFEESPIMSTYLVAIVVGLFDHVEGHTSDGVRVRCYSQAGKANQGKFALEVAVKTLDLYKKYFNVPYPLSKLDMIAIPDFAFGAMENYGLVTYQENYFLYDEQLSSAEDKQIVADTVAHELAHQWFGNLVTMEWWTDLWLNEGFATWVACLATDSLFPEWMTWTQFLEETNKGLCLDALGESHPIEVELNHAHEIIAIFDRISYSKGAAVIRMLHHYLGADHFQRALASYIKRYAYANAKTEDLWAVLEEESNEPVRDIMNSWTKQKGYPVVSVKLNDQKLEIEQSQFLLSGRPEESLWNVPIVLCCGSYDNQQTFLLRTKCGSIEVKESAWVKVNVDQAGFYRVKYDEKLTTQIRSAIESNLLSATDRFGVLDDYYALCMGVQQPLHSLLTLIGSFRAELDYIVLSKLVDISHQLVRVVADAVPEILDSVKQIFITLFLFPARKLGWDPRPGESHLEVLTRGGILLALSMLGHDTTIDEATSRFNVFLTDRNSSVLSSDVRKGAYVAVMHKVSSSDKSGYEALLRVYRETDQSQERARILGSLGSCRDSDIILEVLNFLLSSEVPIQDVVHGLAVSREGREVAWKWMKENWDHISKHYTGHLLCHFVSSVLSKLSSDEMLQEVEEFFASRTKPEIARHVKQSIEKIRINVKWIESVRTEESLIGVVQQLALN
ncbi:aminopeptidase M1-like [Silene latifolia]|uniref:aminopeptidase M1-like n=1 Tax=Silene latifolia TaxID=37657 RepID=UPI003D7703BA